MQEDYNSFYEETATVEITLSEYRDLVTQAAVYRYEKDIDKRKIAELMELNQQQVEQILYLQEQIVKEDDCSKNDEE